MLEPDHDEPEPYNARVPTLPGCVTYGESIEDALANAREATALCLESLLAHGEPIPLEAHPVIATSIAVPPSQLFGPTSKAMEPAGVARS